MKEWTLAQIWNESLDNEEREIAPRDRLYASELGRSDIDIYLKLKGEKPSNPPNDRSYRKFEVGNFFEWIVKVILMRAGIYQSSQDRVYSEMEDLLQVSGKLDFLAGGKPDYEKARASMNDLMLPDFLAKRANNIINYFEKNYPEGLEEVILEIKSVAVIGFNKIEKTGKAVSGHDLQAFHYAFNLQKKAKLIYICRDDMRMIEISVNPEDKALLERYRAKIEGITTYYNDDKPPAPEPHVLFDEDTLKFTKNFNVEYSPFLKTVYGIENPDAYDKMYKSLIGSWNRVVGRIARGEKMTPKNLQALEDMDKNGFNKNLIVETIKSKASEVAEDITEDEE